MGGVQCRCSQPSQALCGVICCPLSPFSHPSNHHTQSHPGCKNVTTVSLRVKDAVTLTVATPQQQCATDLNGWFYYNVSVGCGSDDWNCTAATASKHRTWLILNPALHSSLTLPCPTLPCILPLFIGRCHRCRCQEWCDGGQYKLQHTDRHAQQCWHWQFGVQLQEEDE